MKRRASAERAKLISHLLSKIPYEDILPASFPLPPRQDDDGYVCPPMNEQTFVPEVF